MATNSYPTTNYLVPITGTTHTVRSSFQATGTPTLIDWNTFSVNYFSFMPQGVYVDNLNGASVLTITVLPIGFTFAVGAGFAQWVQFPAPQDSQISITGNGNVNLFWVDFPIFTTLPFSSSGTGGSVVVTNTPLPVSEATLDGVVAAAPTATGLTVQDRYLQPLIAAAPTATGLTVVTRVAPMTALSGTISGAGVSVTLTPPANTNLRKLVVSLSENATLVTAGIDTVSATLNAVACYSEGVYLPATAVTSPGVAFTRTLDFDSIAPNAGAAGTLVVAISTALATGQVNVNAYFD